ncbi:MAG: N-acetylglucosamine-6-phosphate deacetylase, partial [Chloroflexota bacterium]
MTRTLIENAKIITATTPLERGWLLVEDTKISAMGSGNAPSFDNTTRIDANGLKLMPGFIDVHVHG